ncbi:MAG: phosphoribosylformylglycinamidine cyclo-ligase [Armatimonadota bacterium]|nr:phosphoribosylformylglycinamidine cyclo-ligase [Armatimonadota bacterium]
MNAARSHPGREPAHGLTYRQAGVDVEAKDGLLAGLAPVIASTHGDSVVAGVGAFAGAVRLAPDRAGSIVATTDGVGTKTLLARRLGRDAVIGADIVAHCANDLVASGARPLAFLDYIAMARLDAVVVRTLVEAMAAACRGLGIPLLGGETAEMPDVYAGDAYDVVGTMIGTARPDGVMTGETVRPGQRLVGLASSGLHTNGYALARRIIAASGASLDAVVSDRGDTLGDALLQPHQCYAPAVLSLCAETRVHAIAHITGGGIPGNVIRVLPEGCGARVTRGWPVPSVFAWLQRAGAVPDDDMVRTFNLGIGMIVVVEPQDAPSAVAHFLDAGFGAWEIGEVFEGPRGVELA